MTIKDLVRPDFPRSNTAFWDGFTSLFDFRLRSNRSRFDADGDAKALERDWQMVGDDLRKVLGRFESK
jgi:hypothetical protein